MDEQNKKIDNQTSSQYGTQPIGETTMGNMGSTGMSGGSMGGGGSSGHQRSLKETFKHGSPEEVKERFKETVAKGVAAVAGALRGFTEESRKDKLPDQTREAIHHAGETARTAVSSTTEEVEKTRQPLKEASQKLGETARDIGSTAKQEYSQTRDTVKGGKSGGGSSGSSGGQGGPEIIGYEATVVEYDVPSSGTPDLNSTPKDKGQLRRDQSSDRL